jgi:hypothetical protein
MNYKHDDIFLNMEKEGTTKTAAETRGFNIFTQTNFYLDCHILTHPKILILLKNNNYFDYHVDTCAANTSQIGKIDLLIFYRLFRDLIIVHGETKIENDFFTKKIRITLDSSIYLN